MAKHTNLFNENAGVPMVWTFDGCVVKQRPKKNVESDFRRSSWIAARTMVFDTERKARDYDVQDKFVKVAQAREELKRREKALEAAKARLEKCDREEAT